MTIFAVFVLQLILGSGRVIHTPLLVPIDGATTNCVGITGSRCVGSYPATEEGVEQAIEDLPLGAGTVLLCPCTFVMGQWSPRYKTTNRGLREPKLFVPDELRH